MALNHEISNFMVTDNVTIYHTINEKVLEYVIDQKILGICMRHLHLQIGNFCKKKSNRKNLLICKIFFFVAL
jgi:hypothetical protein